MKIRLEHGLAYVEAVLTFRGRSLLLRDICPEETRPSAE
jgi:hypothetical protein